MPKNYVIIGAGRQGVAAAYDLGVFGQADRIQLLDIDGRVAADAAARLNALLGREVARGAAVDAGDIRAIRPYLDDASGCISSVHFTFNLGITRLAIEKRVNLTDFGGNTGVVRQQLELDPEARAAGVSIVPDCGMGPGLNVSLATYVMSLIEEPREVLIWDGGLPQDPQPPWNYACGFALGGLTNEYDGDAYFLRDGRVTPVPCFSGYETLEFGEPIGTLEAFVTSGGLSTAPWTFEGKLQRLENKTLRYPGHAAQFKAFSDLGLLGLEPVSAGGKEVVPRDLFHSLLATRIQREDFKDVCVMRVKGTGRTRGREAEAMVELVDWYDEARGFTAMQRLTGWHGSLMLLATLGRQVRPGVVSVESALPGKTVVDECRRRGIDVKSSSGIVSP